MGFLYVHENVRHHYLILERFHYLQKKRVPVSSHFLFTLFLGS